MVPCSAERDWEDLDGERIGRGGAPTADTAAPGGVREVRNNALALARDRVRAEI